MEGAPSLSRFCLYFLRLGTLGFGGPIALAGAMQRDLVENRRWISREDFLEGLALAQLAPGPLAAQLAIYLGYVRGRVAGATLVGLAFILPSFLMVFGISVLYVKWGGLRLMQALFYGIGAAVVGIIARSAAKLTRVTLKSDPLLWLLFGATALVTATTGRELISPDGGHRPGVFFRDLEIENFRAPRGHRGRNRRTSCLPRLRWGGVPGKLDPRHFFVAAGGGGSLAVWSDTYCHLPLRSTATSENVPLSFIEAPPAFGARTIE